MSFVRRVTSKKWCTAVQNIEFNINISCILCLYFFVSSVQIQSPALYIIQALFLKIFPTKKKKKKKKKRLIAGYAWSEVCMMACIRSSSHFPIFVFLLRPAYNSNFFRLPLKVRFTGSRLWKSGRSVQRVKHGNWRKGNNIAVDMILYFLGRGRGNCILSLPS